MLSQIKIWLFFSEETSIIITCPMNAEMMNFNTQQISRLIFLIALTVIIEMLGLPQPVTGPLVNMMLFITTLVLTPLAGIILGSLTPVIAALRGQLPGFLIPMVPFIIVGNAILVLVFSGIRRLLQRVENKSNIILSLPVWLGILGGSFLKFVWLFYSATLLLPLLIRKPLPETVIAMMAMPQFITALIGGLLAVVILNLLKRRISLN